MQNHFFISGMFRSGTTYLARALNAHPKLTVLSDPHRAFFKYVRNIFFVREVEGFDPDCPIDDYFNQPAQLRQQFHDQFMDLELSKKDIEIFKPLLIKGAKLFSPLIENTIDKLEPGRVSEVYAQLLYLGGKAYQYSDYQLLGTKEVWTDEFIELFLKEGKKCIQIIRDPRAVIASNRVNEYGAYPLLFLIRQWRKSVAYYLKNKGKYGYLMLKYEDLMSDKPAAFQRLTDHLDIPFACELLDETSFVDGALKPWKQNTSYTIERKEKIAGPKWKSVLHEAEIAMIESMCFAEFRLLGYDRVTQQIPGMVFDPEWMAKESQANRAEWIMKYNFELNTDQFEIENKRYEFLQNGSTVPTEIERLFITESSYKLLRDVL